MLPPLKNRPPVYTYFDNTGRKQDEKSKKAEQDLLQIWRRAWWAQGFKPVVLGIGEAMNNPLYRKVQMLELESEMETEMMRWLAWGNMGTGILSNWLAVPMAKHDEPLLNFLRRGQYPSLTRYEGMENGLFVGSKDDVDKVITIALNSKDLESAHSITEAVPAEILTTDSKPDSIAFYNPSTIASNYKIVDQKLVNEETTTDGLIMLAHMINSHLHMTWQNIFTSGIAVLKPLAQNTTSMIEPGIDIARNLSQCGRTPMPISCPPNRPRCKACVSSQPLSITDSTGVQEQEHAVRNRHRTAPIHSSKPDPRQRRLELQVHPPQHKSRRLGPRGNQGASRGQESPPSPAWPTSKMLSRQNTALRARFG